VQGDIDSPQEIMFEARGLPDIDALPPINYRITAAVLDNARR
jgi:hypothetical protein